MTAIEINDGERVEDLGRGGYRIIQNAGGFRFGMDAVLLSAFADVRRGEKAVDLGTGTGIIPILLRARTKGRDFTGLEIMDESVETADRSVRLNGLEDEISIIKGDIRNAAAELGTAVFDVVTCNPPYVPAAHGLVSQNTARAAARHEILVSFEDVARESAALLKPGGRLYLVHRPHRLAEIMTKLCGAGLEPKRMRFVHPYVDREPNLVLIEAHKGGGPQLTVEKPLIVFEKPGVYTGEVRSIYDE